MCSSILARHRFGTAAGALVCMLLTMPATPVHAEQLSWAWQRISATIVEVVPPGGDVIVVEDRIHEAGEIALSRDVAYPDDRRTFSFGSDGALLAARNGSGEIAMAYDQAGRPVEVVSPGAPDLSYGYDVYGRLKTLDVGGWALLSVAYDHLGRIARLDTPAGPVEYRYHRQSGTVDRVLPNGITTRRTYDDEGLLAEIVHVDTANRILARYRYRYRPDGLIGEINDYNQSRGEQTCEAEYDALARLVSWECGRKATEFAYDALGNLVARDRDGSRADFASGTAGILNTLGGEPVEIDTRGHVRRLPGPAGAGGYAYSGAGELASAGHVSYRYNALGQLIARTGDSEGRILPDPFAETWHPLWQRRGDGEESLFVWDGPVPLIEIRGGSAIYRLEDHLGSVRVVLDGPRISFQDYTPYGTPQEPGEGLSPGFAGLFWDADAHVYLTAARAYHPESARFLQPDPKLRLPDNSRFNHTLYAYAGGDPLNFVDRDGTDPRLVESRNSGGAFDLEIATSYRFFLDFSEMLRRIQLGLPQPLSSANATVLVGPRIWPGPGRTMPLRPTVPQRQLSSSSVDASRMQQKLNEMRYKIQRNREQTLDNARRTARFYGNLAETVFKHQLKGALNANSLNATAWGVGLIPRLGVGGIVRNNLLKSGLNRYRDLALQNHRASQVPQDEEKMLAFIANVFEATGNSIEKTWVEVNNARNGVSKVAGITVPTFNEQEKQTLENALYAAILGKEYGALGAKALDVGYNAYRDHHMIRGIAPEDAWSGGFLGGEGWLARTPTRDRFVTVFMQWGTRIGTLQGIDQVVVKDRFVRTQSPFSKYIEGDKANLVDISPHGLPFKVTPHELLASKLGNIVRDVGQELTWASTAHAATIPASPAARPSRVGGVFLGGGSGLLEGLGEISGVALDDATGNLVLLGADGDSTDLPPLRLDDVVTVFRAVYKNGQAPSVTIDPDPADPEGPFMHVKHGPGTGQTYVGWVLFHCDRIMKSYQMGFDNITGDALVTDIPGYQEMQDTLFFGDVAETGRGNWERFWIVPAKVDRFDDSQGGIDVSLFRIPLKVLTQRMQWVNGELVDDRQGRSSAGALAFATWFTQHLPEIADEVRLLPPPASGTTRPVPIFHELSRIALIAAIAERLRDRGVAMPLWMRDREIQPVPIADATPSMTVERRRADGSGERVATIFGGVNLAPSDRDVQVWTAGSPIPTGRDDTTKHFVRQALDQAPGIARSVRQIGTALAVPGTEIALATHRIAPSSDLEIVAAALPGSKTRALGANRQTATDLSLQMGRGETLDLTRHLSSFFDPAGAFGRGWTLDLPRLTDFPVPVTRDGYRSQYRGVPQLSTPLGMIEARFDEMAVVEPYGVRLLVSEDAPEIAGIAGGRNALLGVETRQVMFRDSSVWHFSDAGELLLVEKSGIARRYIRDGAGRLRQIVGYLGEQATAEITLELDGDGRIVSASGTSALAPETDTLIEYSYGAANRLVCVTGSGQCAVRYGWQDGRLASIAGNGMPEQRFSYSPRGELVSLVQGEAKTNLAGVMDGDTLALNLSGEDRQDELWRYDRQMRPVLHRRGGTEISWSYDTDGAVVRETRQDGELVGTVSTDPSGLHARTPDGPDLRIWRTRDGIAAVVDGMEAVRVSQHPNGSLQAVTAGETQLSPRYDKFGLPTGVLVSAPFSGRSSSDWVEETWDVLGRPVELSDASGWRLELSYDRKGRLTSVARPGSGGHLGRVFQYDSQGRLEHVTSSWDETRIENGSEGWPEEIRLDRQGHRSTLLFDDQALPARLESFEGAVTRWRRDQVDGQTRTHISTPGGLEIEVRTDETGTRSVLATQDRSIRVAFEVVGDMTRYTWAEVR